jgi:hypothetical protein
VLRGNGSVESTLSGAGLEKGPLKPTSFRTLE